MNLKLKIKRQKSTCGIIKATGLTNTQLLCLICALFSFSLHTTQHNTRALVFPTTTYDQDWKYSRNGPNLPRLTLKRCVQDALNRGAEVSPSRRHLACDHHGQSVSTGRLRNRCTGRHFAEKERERGLRCRGAKPGSPLENSAVRRSLGDSVGSHFHRRQRQLAAIPAVFLVRQLLI